MNFAPLFARAESIATTLWGRFKSLVDWLDSNRKYVIAILILLNLFGMIAPETATALRDAVLGLAL
jgi:hypothetical protein